MEYALGNRHWLDAFDPPVERQLGKLVQSVRTLLENDTEPVTAPAPAMPAAVAPADSPSEVAPRRPPLWMWASAPVGVLMLGLFAAWLGGVFKVKTSDGVSPTKVQETGASGFVSLFNGKDLSGWTFPVGGEGLWTVQDGIIQGMAYSSMATARSDYKDFHLRMEILKKGGGIAFSCRGMGSSTDRMHYMLNPNPGRTVLPDGTITVGASYWIKEPHKRSPTRDGLQELFTTPELAPLTQDTWQVVEIIAVGNVLRMRVDGREVLAFSDSQSILTHGYIGISIFKGTNLKIRKIEIKELNRTHQ
jgi:hypothetical protein